MGSGDTASAVGTAASIRSSSEPSSCDKLGGSLATVGDDCASIGDVTAADELRQCSDDERRPRELRRERELYEGCVRRKALAQALGSSVAQLAGMGVLAAS